jgi:hypothetical protein
MGDSVRTLPGGYDQIAIPVFSNKSDEVSIETYFTNALRREFERSQVARVTSKDEAPVTLEGDITKVVVTPTAQALAGQNLGNSLPGNTVLNIEYIVVVTARLRLRRHSDQKVIWEQEFNREHVYDGPQIGADFINSANALYEQSSRLQTISDLAEEMMEEAHDCLTENF